MKNWQVFCNSFDLVFIMICSVQILNCIKVEIFILLNGFFNNQLRIPSGFESFSEPNLNLLIVIDYNCTFNNKFIFGTFGYQADCQS